MATSIGEIIIGSLTVLAIITGFVSVYGDYYTNMGVTNPFGGVDVNATGAITYTQTWANQTSTALSNAQAIPFFGGTFMLLTGVFQSLTLLVEFPAKVVIPLFGVVVNALHLPVWFAGFLLAAVMVICMIALIHAMGGGGA